MYATCIRIVYIIQPYITSTHCGKLASTAKGEKHEPDPIFLTTWAALRFPPKVCFTPGPLGAEWDISPTVAQRCEPMWAVQLVSHQKYGKTVLNILGEHVVNSAAAALCLHGFPSLLEPQRISFTGGSKSKDTRQNWTYRNQTKPRIVIVCHILQYNMILPRYKLQYPGPHWFNFRGCILETAPNYLGCTYRR